MFIAEAKIQIPSKRPQNVLCIYYGGPIVNFQNDNGTVSAYQTDKVPEHLQALSEHVISEYQAYTNRQQELAEEERLEKVEFIEKAAKLDHMPQRLRSLRDKRKSPKQNKTKQRIPIAKYHAICYIKYIIKTKGANNK